LFNIFIVDRNGQLVISTAAWPTPSINIADRDYFRDALTASTHKSARRFGFTTGSTEQTIVSLPGA
jgi:hypothetical protein